MLGRIQTEEPAGDLDELIRRDWGRSIEEFMRAHHDPRTREAMSRKEFQRRLALEGVEVTQQAISSWIAGKSAPRPSVQLAIAKVFRAPHHRVFPVVDHGVAA